MRWVQDSGERDLVETDLLGETARETIDARETEGMATAGQEMGIGAGERGMKEGVSRCESVGEEPGKGRPTGVEGSWEE